MDWKAIQRLVGLTADDLRELAAARPLAQAVVQAVTGDFYGQMQCSQPMMEVVGRPGTAHAGYG